jgi:hypothetical protein
MSTARIFQEFADTGISVNVNTDAGISFTCWYTTEERFADGLRYVAKHYGWVIDVVAQQVNGVYCIKKHFFKKGLVSYTFNWLTKEVLIS